MLLAKSLVKERCTRSMVLPVLEQERAIVDVGKAHSWPFRVLGVAPVPEQPVFYKQWWLVPVTQDHSAVPAWALERVRALYAAGIRPAAFVIAHEATPQLPAPPDAPKVSLWEWRAKQLAQHSATVLRVTGQVLAVAVPIVVSVLGVAAMATLGLALSVALTDPALIAVTEDGVWIQIATWMA